MVLVLTPKEDGVLMNVRVVVQKMPDGSRQIRIFNDGVITVTQADVAPLDVGDTVIEMMMELCVAHGIAPGTGGQ